MPNRTVLFQLKVVLNHVKPLIWRRIIVPGDFTVRQLHTVLQVVMGWEESHLHVFKIQEKEYGDPQDDETGRHPIFDEHKYRLDRILPKQVGFRFTYTYDFGDEWEHVLLIEKVLPIDEGINRPVCLAGQRASALEDSGGPLGYMELLETLKNPASPDYEEQREWAGEDFDPETFDLDAVTQQLNRLVDADYQLETLFDFEDDELDELGGVSSAPAAQQNGAYYKVINRWIRELPADLVETCTNLRIRKDYVFLISYLRDHKVKGTASTGNLTLKAVHEINAGFVAPQPMIDQLGYKVRSEDEVPYLAYLHMMAFARSLLHGGQSLNWVVTTDGLDFLRLPPTLQVLDMFTTWLIHMIWELSDRTGFSQANELQMRRAALQVIAGLPEDGWTDLAPLAEQFAQAVKLKIRPEMDTRSIPNFKKFTLLRYLLEPLQFFEVIESRTNADPQKQDTIEIRRTRLGTRLLKDLLEVIK